MSMTMSSTCAATVTATPSVTANAAREGAVALRDVRHR